MMRRQVGTLYAVGHRDFPRYGPDRVDTHRLTASALATLVHDEDVPVRDVLVDGRVLALDSAHVHLFRSATGEVVFGLVLDLRGDRAGDGDVAAALRACRHARLSLDGKPLVSYVDGLLSRHLGPTGDPSGDDGALGPEICQLVHVADGAVAGSDNSTATVAPAGVAVVYGPGGSIPDPTLRFAASLVATSARLRRIQEASYTVVRSFQAAAQRPEPDQPRDGLEELFDAVGNLSFDLSTVALAEGVLRSRVGDPFHAELAAQFVLTDRVRSTMEALAQIEKAITLEMSAVAIRESRTVAVTSLSTAVTVPIAFLAAFFGLNTSDVSGHSIFDVRHFYYVYLVAVLLAAIPVVTYVIGRLRAKRARSAGIRRTRRRARR